MGINKALFFLDSATLATMLTNYTNCLNAIATAGQSYRIADREFTRPDMGEVVDMIGSIKAAQRFQSGSRITRTYTDFRKTQ